MFKPFHILKSNIRVGHAQHARASYKKPNFPLLNRFVLSLALTFYFTVSFCANPITVIVTLTPPYTPFLNEYGAIGIDKLQVTLIVNDNRMINYPAKLQMFVERVNSGIVMRTGEYASIPPVLLTGGSTEMYSGTDLAPYFRAGNNAFSGFDQSQYQFTGRIPDGQYRIGFQVVDAQRSEVILSNTAWSQPGWFVLNDVPQLNMPRNNSEERVNDIQHVKLEWFPRHLGSMNSSFPVNYQVEVFAIRIPGMEPNQVALSAIPDFTDVTTQNRYVLSADKYMLEPGVKYAWRVKAITDQGLTLFANNGYSELYSFVYGSLCPVPLNFYSKSYNSEKAIIRWDGDPLHSSYETRVRARYAEDPVWHTFKGFENSVEINRIVSPNTTYDYQIKAICLATESEYTIIDTFRTAKPVKKNFMCGADDTAMVTNKVPKSSLKAGEYIYNGQFPVKLTTTSGSNGIFTGTGRMRIPFLNNIQINMKFTGLKVNELNQVYGGEMISVYNPNSRFYMDDVTDLWSVGDQVGNVITGQDSAAIHVNYEVTDASGLNVSVNGNTVTVNGAATTISTSTGGTTISDSKGNIYAVDESGNVTQVGVSGGTNNTENYAANTAEYNKINAEMQLVFSDYEEDLWAFDTWRAEYTGKTLVESEYEDINSYKVPWKMVPTGKSGTVEVKVQKGNIDLSRVVFKTPTGTEYFLKDNKLTLIGGKKGDAQEVYALYPVTDDSLVSIGKLKVATYEMLTRNLVLVPIGSPEVDLEKVSEKLNKSWLPYGIEWQVTLDSTFKDRSWDKNNDGKLEAGESEFYSMYSSEMLALNAAYKGAHTTEKESVYIFVFDKAASNSGSNQLLGDMPLSSQFGYIFQPADNEYTYKTYSHEVGHGFFQLRHTFNTDYSLAENDNMMDYSSGTYLFKQQWDAMFDQQNMVFAWAQGDEEGENYEFQFNAEAIELKEKYAEMIYSIINKDIISKNESIGMTGFRGDEEKALIKGVLMDFIHVDPYNLTCYLIMPNDQAGLDYIEMSKDVSTEILTTVSPLIMQSAGIATQQFADIINKAAISKISFELLKSKMASSTLKPALNSLRLAKFAKASSIALSKFGIYMVKLGNVTLWLQLLANDMGPGVVTDERIQESTVRAYVRYMIRVTNSN